MFASDPSWALGQLCFCNSAYALLVPTYGFDGEAIRQRFSKGKPTSTITGISKVVADIQLMTADE